MYKIISIKIISIAILFGSNDIININEMNLNNSIVSRVELVLDSEVDIHGLQFDIKYNPSEIKSVIPLPLSGFEVKYQNMSAGILRGLIFSFHGEALPKNIVFDFTKVDGFSGVSIIDFTDFMMADENGESIQYKPKRYI